MAIFKTKRSDESPQDHEKTHVVIKGLEFMISGKYIDQNTVCSHMIHNQAMYQQNCSSNSYNNHLIWLRSRTKGRSVADWREMQTSGLLD